MLIMGLFLFICLALLVYLATAIHPSERQVAVHYTSFGTTNFYRDKWFYLISFAAYVVMMATVHILLVFKILQEKGRTLAVAFMWLGIVIALMSLAFFLQIFKIASII